MQQRKREHEKRVARANVLGAVSIQGDLARQFGITLGVPRLPPIGGAMTTATKKKATEKTLPERDWIAAENAFRSRASDCGVVGGSGCRGGFSVEPCPICREPFTGNEEHVILSCSHVYHSSCIASFESYTGKRICPLCRKQDYAKRQTMLAKEITETAAATVIQSLWRGHRVRSWIESCKRRGVRPLEDPDMLMREKAERLAEVTDRYLSEMEHRRMGIDSAIDELDRASSQTRQFFKMAFGPDEWERVERDARNRELTDCTICLSSLCRPSTAENGTGLSAMREVTLLSCSHVFHTQCIASFESFNTTEGAPNVCPLCKAIYHRRVFVPNVALQTPRSDMTAQKEKAKPQQRERRRMNQKWHV